MVEIMKGSDRNTKAYIFRLAGIEFFVSYQTVIGVRTNDTAVKLDNVWGRTTGRHMNEMGMKSFKVVSKEDLQEIIKRSCIQMGQALIEIGATPDARKAH